MSEQSQEEKKNRIDRLKKDMENRPSSRPMGYIYPKRIQEILRGGNPSIKVGWTPGLEGDNLEYKKNKHEIGDTWIDSDGKEWEQKEGYTISIPKYIEETRIPNACPKCNKDMYDKEQKLNIKFYWLRGHCFDCQLKEETKIRINGNWQKYEHIVLIQNIMSFLKESKTEILEYLPKISNKFQYVTEDGHLESWEGDMSSVKEFLEKELSIINDDLICLERDLKELNNGIV